MNRLRRRAPLVVAVTASTVAAAAGVAYAAGAFSGSVISACYQTTTGTLRVVDSARDCTTRERYISWNQMGPQGPPGPASAPEVHRAIRATPNEVEITTVGTGPIGFPAEGESPTPVLTLQLPRGLYLLSSVVQVRKDHGNGDLLCYVEIGPQLVSAFVRASPGSDAGHVRRTSLTGDGFIRITEEQGEATTVCTQASNHNVPGSPSGENPVVFLASLTATKVERIMRPFDVIETP